MYAFPFEIALLSHHLSHAFVLVDPAQVSATSPVAFELETETLSDWIFSGFMLE
jgi:hypothetical protein